jgi:hypothetical protein
MMFESPGKPGTRYECPLRGSNAIPPDLMTELQSGALPIELRRLVVVDEEVITYIEYIEQIVSEKADDLPVRPRFLRGVAGWLWGCGRANEGFEGASWDSITGVEGMEALRNCSMGNNRGTMLLSLILPWEEQVETPLEVTCVT